MIELKHVYIVENEEYENINVGVKNYSYFKVLNEHKDIIDIYDFINIKGVFRFDIEGGLQRIYPRIGGTKLYYDEMSHTLLSEGLTE